MSLLSRLLRVGGKPAKKSKSYRDYRIVPESQSAIIGFRITALGHRLRIAGEISGLRDDRGLPRRDRAGPCGTMRTGLRICLGSRRPGVDAALGLTANHALAPFVHHVYPDAADIPAAP